MNDYHTIYMNMPEGVKGFVIKTFDEGEDYYTIVLNPRYNREQNLRTYMHELDHIEGGDLDRHGNPGFIETLCHYGDNYGYPVPI